MYIYIAGSDFEIFDNERLFFDPGDTRVCATFTVRQDGAVEGTEFVELRLTSTTLSVTSPNLIRVSILDSDRELDSQFIYLKITIILILLKFAEFINIFVFY